MTNIIITAGGTYEKIDGVRKITNSSSGKLGSIIADELAQKTNCHIYYLAPRNAYMPLSNKVTYFETTDANSVLEQLMTLLSNNNIDVVIHSMAVADYTVECVIDELSRPIDNTTKIPSNRDVMYVKLVKTPKIINVIKTVSPKTKLIGFKLLSNATLNDLIEASKRQVEVARSDYVVMNDKKDISKTKHKAYIMKSDGEIISETDTKKELAIAISDIVKNLN